MALETATFISDLVDTNPVGSDGLSQADDHIRLVKTVLQATFPNIAGAVTPTHTVLNALPGRMDTVEARLNDLFSDDDGIPVGVITLWFGTAANVPTGWQICNGTNGTPDLRGFYVKGCGADGNLGASGGAASVATSLAGNHAHGGATGFAGSHQHHYSAFTSEALTIVSGLGVRNDGLRHNHLVDGFTDAEGNHQHSIVADGNHQHTVSVDPVHKQIYYIMKVA